MRSGPNNSNRVGDREFTNSIAEGRAAASNSGVSGQQQTQRSRAKQQAQKDADEQEAVLRKLQHRSAAEDPSQVPQPPASRRRSSKKNKKDGGGNGGGADAVSFQTGSDAHSTNANAGLADDVLPPPPSVPLTSQALLMFMNHTGGAAGAGGIVDGTSNSRNSGGLSTGGDGIRPGGSTVRFSAAAAATATGGSGGGGANETSGVASLTGGSAATANRISVNQDDLALAEVGGMYHMSRMVDWSRKDVNIFERVTVLPKVVAACLPDCMAHNSIFMVPFRYKAVENEFLRYEYRGQRYFLAILAVLVMLMSVVGIVITIDHTGPLVVAVIVMVVSFIVLCVEISMIATTNPTRQRISDALSQAKTAEVNHVLYTGVVSAAAAFATYMIMEMCPQVTNRFGEPGEDKVDRYCNQSFIVSAIFPCALAVLQGRPRLVFFTPILFICMVLTYVGRIANPVDESNYVVGKAFASTIGFTIMFVIHRQREMDKRRHFIEYAVYQSQVEIAAKRSKSLRDFVDNMLPPVMRQRLLGFKTIMDISESASCVFVDIANFSQFTFSVLPQDAATTIATLAAFCSEQAVVAGVDRVRSVGDRFIGVSNLVSIAEDHASRCARFGLLLYNAINFSPMFHGRGLALRCGIHSGQLMGGVVGETHIRYDLYGAAYTVANTVVSSCPPSMIICTQEAFVLFAVTKNIISEPARAIGPDNTIFPVEVECPMTQTRHYMHYVLGVNLAPDGSNGGPNGSQNQPINQNGQQSISNGDSASSATTLFSIPNSENLMEVGSTYFGSATREVDADGQTHDQNIGAPFALQEESPAFAQEDFLATAIPPQEAHQSPMSGNGVEQAQTHQQQEQQQQQQQNPSVPSSHPPDHPAEDVAAGSPLMSEGDNNYRLHTKSDQQSKSGSRADISDDTSSFTTHTAGPSSAPPPHQAPVHVGEPLESNTTNTNPMAKHDEDSRRWAGAAGDGGNTSVKISEAGIAASEFTGDAEQQVADRSGGSSSSKMGSRSFHTNSQQPADNSCQQQQQQQQVSNAATAEMTKAEEETRAQQELAQRLSDEEATLLTARRLVSQMVVEDYSTSTSLQRQRTEMQMTDSLHFKSESQEDQFLRHRVDHDLRNMSINSAAHVLILILFITTMVIQRINSSDVNFVISGLLTAVLGLSALLVSWLSYREMRQRAFKRKKIIEWESAGNQTALAQFQPPGAHGHHHGGPVGTGGNGHGGGGGGGGGEDLIREQERGLQFIYVPAARVDGESRNFVSTLLLVYYLNIWLIPLAIALSRPSMASNDMFYAYIILALTSFVAIPFKLGVAFFLFFSAWVVMWSIMLDGMATLWSITRLPIVLVACCYKEFLREKAQRVSFHDVGLTQQAVETINHEEEVRACVLQGMIPPPVQKRAAQSRFSGQFVTWALSDLVVLNIRFDHLTIITTSSSSATDTIELIKQTTGYAETVIKSTCKTLAIVSLFGDNFLLAGPLMDGNEVDVQASACEAILLIDAMHGNASRTASRRHRAQGLTSRDSINSYGSSIRDRSRGEDPSSPNGITVSYPLPGGGNGSTSRGNSRPSSFNNTGSMGATSFNLNNLLQPGASIRSVTDAPADKASLASSVNNNNNTGNGNHGSGSYEEDDSPLQQLSRTCTTVGAIGHATCVLTSNEYPTFDVFGISLNMVRAMLFATPTPGRPWVTEKLIQTALRKSVPRNETTTSHSETDSETDSSAHNNNANTVRPNAAYLQELLKLVQESGLRFGASETWSVRGYGQLRVKSVLPQELQQQQQRNSPRNEDIAGGADSSSGGGRSPVVQSSPGKYQVSLAPMPPPQLNSL